MGNKLRRRMVLAGMTVATLIGLGTVQPSTVEASTPQLLTAEQSFKIQKTLDLRDKLQDDYELKYDNYLERLEQERLEQERLEQERLEQERLEQERLWQETIANSDAVVGGHATGITYTTAMSGYGTTDTLWQWNILPNYYLAEYISPLGPVTLNLSYGDEVYLYGERYTVGHVETMIPNDGSIDALGHARWVLSNYGADAAIQTCEYNYSGTPVRIVVLHKA